MEKNKLIHAVLWSGLYVIVYGILTVISKVELLTMISVFTRLNKNVDELKRRVDL